MILEEYNFKREVLDDPGSVLVDFWAEWCGPCQAMNSVLNELEAEFKICKVNIDTNKPLAKRFQVSVVPTLLIFQNGKIVKRYEGVTPAQTLRADVAAIAVHV
ncbi:MAG: trxA [Gemmataceae bacterium]|nr:trxA [Gemmataceae bacterium]